MKKLFGEAGIKGFLALHVEKLLFGMTMLIALFLIYSGFSNRVGIRPDYDPDQLVKKVSAAKDNINRTTWDESFKEQRETELNFKERAENANQEIKMAAFRIQQPIRPPYQPPRTMRKDPELYAASQLQVHSHFASIEKPASTEIAVEDDPFARAGSGQRRDGMFGAGEEEEEEGTRRIPDSGRAGGFSGYGTERGGGRGGEVVGKYFVAITGLVPYRKQLQAYNEALANSAGYDASRDMPYYFNWILERAEVIDGKPTNWRPIAFKKKMFGLVDEWSVQSGGRGMSASFVDPEATDPAITMPILEMDLSDEELDFLMRHEAIERYVEKSGYGRRDSRRSSGEADAKQDESKPADGLDMFGGPDVGTNGRGTRGNDARMPSGGRGRVGERGRGGGEQEYGGERGGGYGEGYGEGGGYGSGRDSSGLSAGQIPDPEEYPEYKMFRYIDMEVVPGRSYQYRLSLWLEDPNDPDPNGVMEPAANTLDVEVKQRLTSKPEPTEAMKNAKIEKIFWRETEPSDASDVVKVSDGRRLIVGTVEPIDKRGLLKPGEEPSAEVMALEFDAELATNVPGKFRAYRGTVANVTMDTEVPNFTENKLKERKDYFFQVNTSVVDMSGGESLGLGDLTAPAELLVYRDGKMTVVDELSSESLYEKFDFPPESEVKQNEFSGGREGDDENGRRNRRGSNRRNNRDRGNEGGQEGGR